jgi:guanylate kinase
MKVKTNLHSSSPYLLIVLSGPSGVGKDTILNEMKKASILYHRIVTITTRDKRKGEIDGKDYHFTTVGSFKKMIKDGQLLEWAKVYENFYGVPLNPVRKALNQQEDVIIKVDVQGVASIKKVMPEAVAIFLSPPSDAELERRLQTRGDESANSIKLRLKTAKEEYKKLYIFDYIVENYKDDIDLTIAKIAAIISSEKCRISRIIHSQSK